MKNIAYQVKVKINDPQHLRARMKDAVATVAPNMLHATLNEVEYRLDNFHASRRVHIKSDRESYVLRRKR
jgi:hypothetical protein